jgi:hypothetical protein
MASTKHDSPNPKSFFATSACPKWMDTKSQGHSVQLVALSGYALPEDLQRARDAGFDHHMAKPPNLQKLEEMLATLPLKASFGDLPDSETEVEPSAAAQGIPAAAGRGVAGAGDCEARLVIGWFAARCRSRFLPQTVLNR